MNRTLEFIQKWLRQIHPAGTTLASAQRRMSHIFQQSYALIPLGLLLALTLAACSGSLATSTPQAARYPIPTSHGLFSEKRDQSNIVTEPQLTTTPTVANFFREYHTATPQPTKTPTPTSPPSINEFPVTGAYSQTLYADSFNPNWSVERDNRV